jgi:broad specificity phosphatase PhoE
MSLHASPRYLALCIGILIVLVASGLGFHDDTERGDSTVTVFLVRHAEKESSGRDPDLSLEGRARADRLGIMLIDQSIDAVFVTRTKRSYQTGFPTAKGAGINPVEYHPTDMDALVTSINAFEGGDSVLVVAHSNTLPLVLKALGGREMPDLDESEYDRFIAVIADNGQHVKTIELRF